jgi:Putative glucoamylase/Protein of unknown function (DUF3131)
MLRSIRSLTTVAGATAVIAACLVAPASAAPADVSVRATAAKGGGLTGADRAALRTYAKDTWRSFLAMVEPDTGLPDDNIEGDLDPASRGGYTSPTNIGAYLWSTVIARDIGLIDAGEARQRMSLTLRTMERVDRHDDSGMYYNWYVPKTGEVLRTDPDHGTPIVPFRSSVDNGWFAAALMVVANAEPRLRDRARDLLKSMRFDFYYNPEARGPDIKAGLLRGGFWESEPSGCFVKGNHPGEGAEVYYTCNHYDILNSEPRIASYIGIALGQIPREHYFATNRTFPDTCDWSWLEQKAVGFRTEHLGIPVFEGAFTYRGLQFLPSWGGDMFEELMPDMFVPEAAWGPTSWGVNHPTYVRGHIVHGMEDAKYGYWGFSPASNPNGGYGVWGVDALGMDPGGYPSDVEATNLDLGFGDCRPAQPEPTTYGDGVVTPHAAFLALPYAPRETMSNLANLKADFAGAYGKGGFKDAIAVRSGKIADRYLSLDQGMVMGALGNVMADNAIRRYFSHGEVERAIKPLLRMETFNAKPVGHPLG